MSDYIQTDKAFVLEDYTTLSIDANIYNPGYTFTGWNTSPNGSGTSIAANAIYDPKSDISVYAQWNKQEFPVEVNVYSWYDQGTNTIDYSAKFTQTDGQTFITTSNKNQIMFTQLGSIATLEVESPGVMVAVVNESDTIGGQTTYINIDPTISKKTINFTIGEFTQLNISKIPVEQELSVSGRMHTITHNYTDAGTIFGGYYYIIHWYDSCKFTINETKLPYTSTSAAYTFNRSDKCFINIAHLGDIYQHNMHLSCGYFDNQTNSIHTLVSFEKSGMTQSKNKALKNFYTCEFNELSIDLRSYPLSNTYFIGYSILDESRWQCTGIKFRGKYKLYVNN